LSNQSERVLNDVRGLGGDEMSAARQASRDSIAFGAILTVLGVFAVLAPMFAGITVTVLLGMLLIFAGIAELVFAFQSGSFGKGVLRSLFGGLSVLAGVVILATPASSLGVLTFVLAGFLLAGGVLDIVFAFKQRPGDGWGWVLFSGIMSILLGLLIIWQWPVSGIWAVGLYAGIRMLTHGWLLMGMGRTGQESLTLLQDTRIEKLEDQVRSGALALLETQAALADHTAVLLALDSEVRKKVSLTEVDPAIVALNEKLGEARVQMQQVADATEEAWQDAQKEASAAFKQLQKNSAELRDQLKQELGLETADEK